MPLPDERVADLEVHAVFGAEPRTPEPAVGIEYGSDGHESCLHAIVAAPIEHTVQREVDGRPP